MRKLIFLGMVPVDGLRARISRVLLAGAAAAVLIVGASTGAKTAGALPDLGRTYTTDADFDEGTLVGVEHETTHDQLQLSKTAVTLPFIWVPNNEGTVSKVNTETGQELGRYRVAPYWDSSPSRTTVDLQGNAWVGNRQAGTAVKIGLYEAGQCVDRNGSGTIETSLDSNSDGDITGPEILPWGEDECVLQEVVLVPGHEGVYVPGTYAGPYDHDYWGVAPRGFAVDVLNNVWIGTWSTSKFYYVDGNTGAILNMVDVSPWGHHSYGAVIDGNGVLWSAQLYSQVLRLNPANLAETQVIPLGHTYGLGLDYSGHLFVGGGGALSKIDVTDGTVIWTKPAYAVRGVVATGDNDVWVAGFDAWGAYDAVSRYDNDGNLKATVVVGMYPSGVAVDAAGKVWASNIGDDYIKRIDPTADAIDLSKAIVGSGGHYTYSDMTGIVSRTITTKIGTWTVKHDTGAANTRWGTVSWTSSEPVGTSITVKARSSNDGVNWSAWELAGNGTPLSATPDGRLIQIQVTLQILAGEESPILYDLTVRPANEPPVCVQAVPSVAELWPPDHKMAPVSVLGVTDPDRDPVSITITGITQDEPLNGLGDGDSAPDGSGIGTDTAWVRGERAGTPKVPGDGRVYHIHFQADDGKGGTCEGSVSMGVPHDQRPGHVIVDGGELYNSVGP